MTTTLHNAEGTPIDSASLIPDFCRGRTLLILAFAMQLIAVVFTLAARPRGDETLFHLALLSLYLHWIGFCSAALLCGARRWLSGLRPAVIFPLAWLLLVGVSLSISAIGYEVCRLVPMLPNFPDESRLAFMLRSVFIDGIVSLLLLRYFWLRQQWRTQVQAEGESRFQALNARIQPHFLFNSLNSIAALIATRPKEAETMVEDLADLFRASLQQPAQRVPLSEEIALVKTYLRIEQVRMGERMRVEWHIADGLLHWPVPRLVLQPLVENAVHHGISRLREPGTLRIHLHEQQQQLHIRVENPVPPEDAAQKVGNRIAVHNIAQRLQLIYGTQASLQLGLEQHATAPTFCARLVLPLNVTSESTVT